MLTKPRGKYHHGQLAEALIGTALEELDKHSLDKLSLRGIARQVGVTATAAYKHFASKEDLVAAVREAAFMAFVSTIRQAAESSPVAEQSMIAMGMAYLDFAEQHANWFDLIFSAPAPNSQDDAATQLFTQAALALNPKLADQDLQVSILQGHALIHGLAVLRRQGMLGNGHHPELTPDLIERIFVRTRQGWLN